MTIETSGIKVTVRMVEVDDPENAEFAIVLEDHPELGLMTCKLYEIHKNKWMAYDLNGAVEMEDYFTIDDNGNKNFGILNAIKNKLYKLTVS